MREEAVIEMVKRHGGDFRKVERLVERGLIKKVKYLGTIYYVRRFR